MWARAALTILIGFVAFCGPSQLIGADHKFSGHVQAKVGKTIKSEGVQIVDFANQPYGPPSSADQCLILITDRFDLDAELVDALYRSTFEFSPWKQNGVGLPISNALPSFFNCVYRQRVGGKNCVGPIADLERRCLTMILMVMVRSLPPKTSGHSKEAERYARNCRSAVSLAR